MVKLSSNFKQKNKKFKGLSKGKGFEKNKNNVLKKKIKKSSSKLDRRNKNNQIQYNKTIIDPFDYLKKNLILNKEQIEYYKQIKKKNKNLRIILIIGMNEGVDSLEIMNLLTNFMKNDLSNIKEEQNNNEMKYNHFSFIKPKNSKYNQLKGSDNLLFISCPRNISIIMDYLKVADILLLISSTYKVNIKESNLNPHKECNAFDNFSLEFITKLKSFSEIPILALIPDLYKIPINKQKEVKFYFKRFYECEFSEDLKIFFLKYNQKNNVFEENEIIKLFMDFMNITIFNPKWRENRGYMLVESIKKNNLNQIEFKGTIQGNGFTNNETLHLTNYGNLKPKKIVILSSENNIPENIEYFFENLIQNNDNQIIEEKDENIEDEFINDLNNKFEKLEVNSDKEEMNEEIEDKNDESDISIEDYFKEENNNKNKKVLYCEERNEKDFEDEIDYNSDIILREEFKDYKYLKDFKKNNWNIYHGIPEDDFKKIKIYEKPYYSHKNSEMYHLKNIRILNGFVVKIIFEDNNLENYLGSINKESPLILSNLFKHEENKTLLHINCTLHNDALILPESYKNYKITMGFKNFISNIMFSKVITKTTKSKFVEKVNDYEVNYLASFYGDLYFPNKNCIIMNMDNENMLMTGNLELPNPLKVILKRIILTGYPLKIKKKKAVVRHMFFNEDDVKFYMQNEVFTKRGLRGNIKESLGTHGLMKIHFNGAPNHGDTICMSLYKRVFPLMSY